MTFADSITADVLAKLGYREPKEHSQYSEIVDGVQDRIDENLEIMRRAAGREAIPNMRHILEYEGFASAWWGSRIGWKWLQNLAGCYLAWKTKRKYARYKHWLKRAEQ